MWNKSKSRGSRKRQRILNYSMKKIKITEPKRIKGKVFSSLLKLNLCECGETVISHVFVNKELFTAIGFCRCGNIFVAEKPQFSTTAEIESILAELGSAQLPRI